MKSLFIWTSIFLLGFAASANAEVPTVATSYTSILTYDVYAGGIHAMNAKLTIKKDAAKYEISLDAGTQGFLKQMADWSGKYQANGNILNNKAFPIDHQAASTWRESTESKIFKYDGKGHFQSYTVSEDGNDKTPKDLDLSLATGTIDLLSATFNEMLNAPKDKACKGKELVFDGDRTFYLQYVGDQMETLQKTDYNVYEGAALACTVEVLPEKGKWRKKPRGWLSIQEQGRKKGGLPTIWFGTLKEQPDIYVPVKIRIKTDYGTLFLHLTSVKNG